MPTLLEAVNEVLLQVGEREVSSFSSPVARKARLAIRRAQNFVGTLHQWRHLRATVSPSRFVGDICTLPPFLTIYSVYRGTQALQPINLDAIIYKVNTANSAGNPRYYSIVGENSVLIYPSPTPTEQTQIRVSLLLDATVASNPADVLEGPDGYVDLVTLYAQVVMHRIHTTDLNAADATAREFETSVHMYRTLNVIQPISYL